MSAFVTAEELAVAVETAGTPPFNVLVDKKDADCVTANTESPTAVCKSFETEKKDIHHRMKGFDKKTTARVRSTHAQKDAVLWEKS